MNKKLDSFIFIGYLLILILFVITLNNSFFWDTVQLGSKHANYFYSTNFSNLILPNNLDSGHIPSFGIYLALIWNILGRSLVVSHLAMLPFVLGILWQLQKLIEKFIRKEYVGLAFLLVLFDPTLLSQMTLVSPDVPLVFFFLLGLNSIFDNKKNTLIFSIVFLFLVSMRGMMVSFSLLIIDLIININFSNPIKNVILSLLKRSLLYIPALFIFIAFSIYHYTKSGWIGFHADSPWSDCFENVGFKGFIYNIGILGWRIIDFGRVGIWVVFIILYMKLKANILKNKQTVSLLFIFIIFLVILPVNMLWAKNLLGHRYLLPIFLSFSILCAHILFTQVISNKSRTSLVLVWLVVLITGNLWVYPDRISKGWDATLGHLPYYKIRKDANQFLDEKGIDFKDVQSFFPNTSVINDIDLNNDYRILKDFNDSSNYVFYSNIYNVSDEDLNIINKHYSVIKQFNNGSIYIKIYKKYQNSNSSNN